MYHSLLSRMYIFSFYSLSLYSSCSIPLFLIVKFLDLLNPFLVHRRPHGAAVFQFAFDIGVKHFQYLLFFFHTEFYKKHSHYNFTWIYYSVRMILDHLVIYWETPRSFTVFYNWIFLWCFILLNFYIFCFPCAICSNLYELNFIFFSSAHILLVSRSYCICYLSSLHITFLTLVLSANFSIYRF